MKDDTGGPAFPHIDSACGRFHAGMTLRDYFAAKAMLMSFGPQGSTTTKEQMAGECYAMADAMLEARK